ncbi:MAG TPA: tol-pal system protein YbgF [Candidatus Saccharimonadales bacterium]|nr:tol-pal system protein YbgF [Candidatus Saccharimonadales bacterium]
MSGRPHSARPAPAARGGERAGRAAALLALALGLPALTGCYGGKTFQAVQRLEVQTAILDSLQRAQQAELKQLRQQFSQQSDFMRSSKADNDTRVSELARRLDVVVGKLEDSNQRFADVLQKIDASRAPAPADTSPGDTTGAAGVRDPKPLYDAAYTDYTNGRYDLARAGFQQYVTSFGQTELAGNAQFWIGETFYQQDRYEEAAAAYQAVLDKYPHNIKCPGALLKLGLSQAALGQRSAARATLRRVGHEYPGTEEARLAAQKLRRM